MKQALCVLGALGLVLVSLTARPLAQSATLTRELLKDWVEMKATMAKLAALIREQTDPSMFEVVPTTPFLGPSSRARVIYFLIGHSWNIYGQMVVYLRLNGGVPPASQRP